MLGADVLAQVLHWIDAIAASDVELACAFAERAPRAGSALTAGEFERWIDGALRAFDQRGLGAAIGALDELDAFMAGRSARAIGVTLDEESALLQRLVAGLGGRPLRIESGPVAYTDTEAIVLPPRIDRDSTRAANFSVYKVMAVHHWAQASWGTWRPAVLEALRRFDSPDAALASFAALERARLDARVAREFPGIGREMRRLEPGPDHCVPWSMTADADAEDSLARVPALMGTAAPAPRCYHGAFLPDAVAAVLYPRLELERRRLPIVLGELSRDLDPSGALDRAGGGGRGGAARYTVAPGAGADRGHTQAVELRLDGAPVHPPAEMGGLIASIVQDLGTVPAQCLVAAGTGAYAADAIGIEPAAPAHDGLFESAGTCTYPEWDHIRQRYRAGYCTVRELDVEPADEQFVARTLAKHAGLVKSVRRGFEAIVNEARSVRRQTQGEDIDIDAIVEAQTDLRLGHEPSERVYTRLTRRQRNIAVLIMVDMSGSTRGWINDAEREALVLLVEALERLGDAYAIYGFSGRTHKRCEVYRVKRFDESYLPAVRRRVSGIAPKGYTRLGACIRHLGAVLAATAARTRILITLSDGKPEDYRSYRGVYGIEDTRRALLELRRAGIRPYCITIDRQGASYLPHMYGPANFIVIDAVPKLPMKVADIYRRLTT